VHVRWHARSLLRGWDRSLSPPSGSSRYSSPTHAATSRSASPPPCDVRNCHASAPESSSPRITPSRPRPGPPHPHMHRLILQPNLQLRPMLCNLVLLLLLHRVDVHAFSQVFVKPKYTTCYYM
jgi:hypothetical protein